MNGCRQTQAVVNGWLSANLSRRKYMDGYPQTRAVANGWLSANSSRCEWMAVGKLKPFVRHAVGNLDQVANQTLKKYRIW